MSFINNENILQACATVFAGVLILLTIERKFEVKDVAPEYIHELNRDYEEKSSDLKHLQNQYTLLYRTITDEEKAVREGKTDRIRLNQLKVRRTGLEKRLEKARNDLKLTETTVNQVREQQKVSKVDELRAQRIKNIEDLTTLVTLALFSLCIVFMLFVDINWNYSIFNYSTLSKLLFSLALLVLLIRVCLRGIEYRK